MSKLIFIVRENKEKLKKNTDEEENDESKLK